MPLNFLKGCYHIANCIIISLDRGNIFSTCRLPDDSYNVCLNTQQTIINAVIPFSFTISLSILLLEIEGQLKQLVASACLTGIDKKGSMMQTWSIRQFCCSLYFSTQLSLLMLEVSIQYLNNSTRTWHSHWLGTRPVSKVFRFSLANHTFYLRPHGTSSSSPLPLPRFMIPRHISLSQCVTGPSRYEFQ